MQRKAFHVFLMHAAFFLTLIGVLGGTNEVYARWFHRVGNSLLVDMGPGLSVRFQWAEPHKRRDSADTRMLGRRAGELDYVWRAIYSARRRGFWPSATLLALTLALPMSRRRRAVASVLGLALFNAFFLAEVTGISAVFFRASGAVPGATPGVWRDFVPLAEAMFNSPITNFAMVFLIWASLGQPARGIEFDSVAGALGRLLGPAAGGLRAQKQLPPPQEDDARRPGDRPDA